MGRAFRPAFSMFAWGIALSVLQSPANASLATFDALAEGFYGETELVDGGIRFFNPDDRAHGPGASIAIDDVSEVFPYFAEFAVPFLAPNVLVLSGIGPGADNWAAARFGELTFTTGQIETFASVDVFHLDDHLTFGNSIVLEAFLGGESVGRDWVVQETCCHHFDRLAVSGVPFDTLVVYGDGPQDDGVFFGAIDNVVVVPEPAPIILLMLATGALAAFRSWKTARCSTSGRLLVAPIISLVAITCLSRSTPVEAQCTGTYHASRSDDSDIYSGPGCSGSSSQVTNTHLFEQLSTE